MIMFLIGVATVLAGVWLFNRAVGWILAGGFRK